MAKINDIKNIIASAAAKNNMPTYENGNNALKVAEPVIPLPNQPADSETSPAPSVQLSRRDAARLYMKEHFVENREYMRVPGVPKPILTKKGAYALLHVTQLRESIEIVNVTILPESNFVSYTVRCRLITQDGEIIAEALGAANTQEAKFAKSGLSAQHLVASQSAKRALVNALRNIIL